MLSTLPPLGRRRFLAGSLAAGLWAVLPKNTLASEEATPINRWVFLADTHIPGVLEDGRHGTTPNEQFRMVREEILNLKDKPQGVIVAGDAAFLQGRVEDYVMLKNQVEPLRREGIPFYVSLGNHDNIENYYKVFTDARPDDPPVPGKNLHVLETPEVNLFLLDSLYETNHTPGFLGVKQLLWLDQELTARKEKPAVLIAHHNLESFPGALMDREELWRVVEMHEQVKAYIYGHSHIYQHYIREDVHLINLPALGWKFDEKQPLGWTDAVFHQQGVKMTLHTADHSHPKNGDVRDLTWLR